MPKGRIEVIAGGMFCHRAGQKVIRADGVLVPIEGVRVGDFLIGDTGLPVRVTATHQGHGQMAEIRPNRNHTSFVVTIDHYLTLTDTPSNPKGKPSERGGRIVDVSVRDWLGWSRKRKGRFKLFQVGVSEFATPGIRDDDLDPYLLGVLLGDGCLRGRVAVTTADDEIAHELALQADLYGLSLRVGGKKKRAQSYRLVGRQGVPNPIWSKLQELGLAGTTSGTKFIPYRYKTASVPARLQLLAGLIDTDGCSSRGAGFDYVSKSTQLAEDVAFVARSLGLAATITPKKVKGAVYARVYIGGDVGKVPTKLPRKKLSRTVKHRPTVRGFQVHLLGDEDFYGVTVEGGRYLLGDFTVTHNSGKSEELVRRLRRAQIAKKCVLAVKHASDDRYHPTDIGSHAGTTLKAEPCHRVEDLREIARGVEVLGIDEAQFFGEDIVKFCTDWANAGVRVIVAGLDMDSEGNPFEPMPRLMAVAEDVTKLHAVCVKCGGDASFSYHRGHKEAQVEVGADQYEARCRRCFQED